MTNDKPYVIIYSMTTTKQKKPTMTTEEKKICQNCAPTPHAAISVTDIYHPHCAHCGRCLDGRCVQLKHDGTVLTPPETGREWKSIRKPESDCCNANVSAYRQEFSDIGVCEKCGKDCTVHEAHPETGREWESGLKEVREELKNRLTQAYFIFSKENVPAFKKANEAEAWYRTHNYIAENMVGSWVDNTMVVIESFLLSEQKRWEADLRKRIEGMMRVDPNYRDDTENNIHNIALSDVLALIDAGKGKV